MVVGLLLAFFTSVAVDSVERPKRVSLLYGYAPDVPVHDAPHNHVPEKVEKEQEAVSYTHLTLPTILLV